MKFLVIEDDPALAEMVKECLASKSHIVEVASDGADGSFLGRSFAYDAIVLDYSLPKKNGFEVIREIRDSGRDTPIVFMSATDDSDLRVKALELGADDFLVKPFAMEELRARIKAISRRHPTTLREEILQLNDLTVNIERHEVTRGTSSIRLTRKEFNMLEFMIKHKGQVLSRATIMEHVWTADSDMLSNTVEAHIRNLRHKLNTPNRANLIVNIPGRGYVIDEPEKLKKYEI